LVIADEPTAALDPKRSDSVMEMFVVLAQELQTTLVVATHDVDRVARFGLRPLRHEFLQSSQPATTASRFAM
jgi:putative ABC transport system ATP-binding protein